LVSLPVFGSNNIPAPVYTWTVDKNIGLPLSGSGNLPSFIAVNTTSDPITATIVATASMNGCIGTNTSFKVTVQPAPAPALTINNAAQCLAGNSFLFTDQTTSPSMLDYQWDFG